MRSRYFLPLLVVFLFLLDLYVFQGVSAAVSPYSPSVQMGIFIGFWVVALVCWFIVLSIPRWRMAEHVGFRMVLITLMLGIYLGELLAAVFFLIDDLRRGGLWMAALISHGAGEAGGIDLQRSLLLSRLGLLAGAGLLATLIYGFSNKYDYKIRRVSLHFPHLPSSFKGLKIVQLSDIHSGSFDHYQKVKRGVELVLKENADLIFFTGDLVNNHAEEVKDYVQLFSRLRAPLGVYSILGNHDYGDYGSWPTETAKTENLQRLKDLEAEMGWKMLNNAHALVEKDGQQIAVIGVENWSAKARFPKYGDLQKAYAGAGSVPFKILLSHDPSHWDAQVLPEYPDIDLMLAGHTHGMQFGVEIPGFRWSPIQWVYKQWAGLYRQKGQYLYVNRGFGFLGYPGRVGIRPEITVIELV
ncbi:MAG TPA: metallophosphoesterase [Chitinophagaceae bacterium]|nr:metallophosphoesterase [Chitinophagaceae bacterium]